MTRKRSLVRVCDDVNECDTIQPYHLLKVDITIVVSVDKVARDAEVCSVRIGFQDIAPGWVRRFRNGDMEEDGFGAGFEDGVGMLFKTHRGREQPTSEDSTVERYLEVQRTTIGLVLNNELEFQTEWRMKTCTNLCDNQIFREFRKSDDVFEKKCLFIEKV